MTAMARTAARRSAIDEATRRAMLDRFAAHSRRFDAAAARRGAPRTPATESPARMAEPSSPTGRELQVLELAAEGLSNREIGQRLVLAENTVKCVIKKLLARLGAASRAHAVAIGFRRGLLA